MSRRVRHAVRVLLLDEQDRLLLFRGEQPDTGAGFWFPAGGGVEGDEDVRAAAAREVEEETGLEDLTLGAEVWRRRHLFTWRDVRYDQRERWFLARVASFEPDTAGWTDVERADLKAWRWWTLTQLDAATEDLVPRDLARRLRALLVDGPPPRPIDVGV